MKPKAILLSGYGINCEDETAHAFELAGAHADIVHINDLIAEPSMLKNYKILAVPGGFSYGDDTGSGKAFANKVRNHLMNDVQKFLERDTLAIGICNGFQIITQLGLVPGALIHNKQARYIGRWVDLKVTSDSPWLTGIETLSCPIAHGEGNFYADDKTLKQLEKNNAIAFKYFKGEVSKELNLEANPNGSLQNIAGVTSYNGRVLGMMPHPERAMFTTQLPHWNKLKQNKKLPKYGPGLKLFQNAVRYFK